MKALDGVVVISIEHAIAAPFASRHLADQGARVIKIERPDGGDFARSYDARVRGMASHFTWVNRSKESVCIDLQSQKGKAIFRSLIKRADVFIQNLGPGVCESLGLGDDRIAKINPNCITCSISGYGRGGPLEQRKAYDLLVQAESGLISITGTEDCACKVGISIADIAAGTYAYTNILNALIQRQNGGAVRHIEVSMLEALTEWMGFPLYYCIDSQGAPPRSGAMHATIFPYGPYDTSDGGTVFIAIQHEREWRKFCSDVLQDSELAEDASYFTNYQRNAARDVLQRIIAHRIKTLSVEEVLIRLDRAELAFSTQNNVSDVWRHRQLVARGRFVEVGSPIGNIQALLPPGMTPDEAYMGRIPALGEHTDSVLAWLEEVSGA
jgi:itaconate CoA-transferase